MTSASIANLVLMQEPDGSFASEVSRQGWIDRDCNGFTTAMVLRALRDLPNEGDIIHLRSAALDFIERCGSAQIPGAFGFWPEDVQPAWVRPLPPDIDDTAIITIELLRHGRLNRRDGLRTVCSVFIPNRFFGYSHEIRPPWVVRGAFRTWIGEQDQRNVVDCCVNANAIALMSLVDGSHLPGYQEAISTIVQGVAWAGRDPIRQQTLMPFYPSIHALQEAVEHAVECGAAALRPTLHQLQQRSGEHDIETRSEYCRSAYGRTVWSCQGLAEAHALRAQQMATY